MIRTNRWNPAIGPCVQVLLRNFGTMDNRHVTKDTEDSQNNMKEIYLRMEDVPKTFYPSILCVGTLWVPHEAFMTRTMANLESIQGHLLESQTFLILTGYVQDDAHWSEIVQYTESWPQEKFRLHRSEKNVGKAVLVNEAVQEFIQKDLPKIARPPERNPFDFLLTWDADMVFIEPLIDRFQSLTSLHKHGIIAPMQDLENCHLIKLLRRDDSQKVFYSVRGGIAGGCWFLKYECWTQLQGYPVLGVYASDDATFLSQAMRRGYSCVVSQELHVEHQNVKLDAYNDWKFRVLRTSKPRSHAEALEDVNKLWSSPELK